MHHRLLLVVVLLLGLLVSPSALASPSAAPAASRCSDTFLPLPRAGRRPSTDLGEAAGAAGWEGASHLAGNVRRLRQPDGRDLGGYRYSAFGETLEDTVVLQNVNVFIEADNRRQPLRWKGMWRFEVAGTELYDARARMWSPRLGTFLSVDEYDFHDPSTTLWGWPGQNSIRWSDPFGRGRGAEDSRSGFTQALFDLSPNSLDATAGFGTGLLDNIPLFPVQGSPTLGSLAAAGGLSGQQPAGAGACASGGDNDAANGGRALGGLVGALVLARGGAGPGSAFADPSWSEDRSTDEGRDEAGAEHHAHRERARPECCPRR